MFKMCGTFQWSEAEICRTPKWKTVAIKMAF